MPAQCAKTAGRKENQQKGLAIKRQVLFAMCTAAPETGPGMSFNDEVCGTKADIPGEVRILPRPNG